MKKMLMTAGTLASLISGHALASDFQSQFRATVGGATQDVMISSTSDITVDTLTTGISARVHFNKISTEGHPLEEASFLEHSSYLGFAYSHDQVDADGPEHHEEDYTFDLRMVTQGGVIVGAEYNTFAVGSEDHKLFTAAFEGGYYVNDFTAVTVQILDGEDNQQKAEQIEELRGYALTGKSVIDIGSAMAIGIELALAKIDWDERDNQDIVSFEGDFFITPRIHVGLGYTAALRDDDDIDTVTLEAQAFVMGNLAIGASVSSTSYDDEDLDDEAAVSAWVEFRI